MFALLALHLVLGAAIVGAGPALGRRAFSLAALAPLATLIWAAVQAPGVIDGDPVTERFMWVAGLDLAIDLRLDAFGLVMLALISGIGLLICIYSLGYFADDGPGVVRLAGVMVIFAGSMLGIVLSDQLIALFIFWELTSVTSFLLIGNDDTNPRARASALQALMITGLGGLTMLAGLILVGQAGGTYLISELLADPPSGTLVDVGLILVLVGAFTKSAQVPFSSWLPGAMVAPTPVSAYLHSATMVKAGVYLVARFAPMFATEGAWRPLVLIVGAVTMFVGGYRALRQHDLKLLLAYGTVSQLGFMMLLLGTGNDHIAEAGIILLLAHGCFKAALFMVVGIIDHGTGTRDIRELHGFDSSWRAVQVVAVVSAASMAGLPPLLGFIAKEKGIDGYLEYGDFGGGTATLVVIVVASILTFAYSARFVLGVFGRFGESAAPDVSHGAHAPSALFVGPAVVLTACTVVFGVAPRLIDPLVEAATIALEPGAEPSAVVLWGGFNAALLLSVVIIAGGTVLTVARRPVESAQRRATDVLRPVPASEQVFWASLRGIGVVARRTTAVLQNGSLPVYLSVIMVVVAGLPAIAFLTEIDHFPEWVEEPVQLALVAVIVVAGIGAMTVRRRMAAALMLSAIGYAMAGLYVSRGAPDLALTQFAIETLATVLFVLVLRFLPRTWSHRRAIFANTGRVIVASIVGAAVFVFALSSSNARVDVVEPSMSGAQTAASEPEGHGKNVVNVILVDFRGWDTMGEITVLTVAAVGAVSIARTGRRRRVRGPVFEEVLDDPTPVVEVVADRGAAPGGAS